MKAKTKIWLTVAALLILTGVIVIVVGMTMLKWNFSKLSTDKYEEKSYEITENFKGISIISNTADIKFLPSENDEIKVVSYDHKSINYSVSVDNDTLKIEVQDDKRWYEHIGFNFESSKITVYIPKDEYGSLAIESSTGDVSVPGGYTFKSVDISLSTGDAELNALARETVKIKTSTGQIRLENVCASSIDLDVSLGKIYLSNISCTGNISTVSSTGKAFFTNIACGSLDSKGDTGDISLENVIAEGKLSVERDTGDVKLEKCDAGELFVKTSTGDVTGTLLSDKVFIVDTSTGRKDVPSTVTGGVCKITTSTGDIKIRIEQ